MRPKQYGLALAVISATLALPACGGDDSGTTPDVQPDTPPVPGDPANGTWRTDFAVPGLSGPGSRVEALARGTNGEIYAAGIFLDAAGLPVANVATWNRTEWVALGDGVDGWVRALVVDGTGAPWAAVISSQDNTGSVRRWSGTAWIDEGAADGQILDMLVVGSTIIVVGPFTTIGGVAAGGVALHDATGWHAVGAGETVGTPTAIAAQPGGFCVAGFLESIGGVAVENAACWNGTAWSPLGAGLPGGAAVLARSPAGVWYAGGTMTFVIDQTTGEYEAGIARLTAGTWAALDGGIDNGFINEVRAIAFAGNDVLIGGCFATAGTGDLPAAFLARWSPANGWSELAGGLATDIGLFLPSIAGGNDLLVDTDGSIWIGGLFSRAGGVPAVNIARLPAAATAPVALVGTRPVLGLGGFVDALAAAPDGTVIAGGGFRFAGQTRTSGLVRFDGSTWTDLSAGLEGIVRDVLVRADGSIVAAGELFVANEPVAVAVRVGTTWTLPGGPLYGTGFAVVEHEGALWVGGDLLQAGAVTTRNLARLSGTTWAEGGNFNDRVTSLVVHDGALVAGGLFSTVDGASAKGVARRSGTAWAGIGGGLDGDFGYVNALASSPTLGLIVGGSFPGAGGVAARGLVRWDGAAWRDVGGGVSNPGSDSAIVSGLRAHGNGLFVTGAFQRAGSGATSVAAIAWFDGTAWHSLGSGLDDLGEPMIVVGDALYVGGPFTFAGFRASSGIGVWAFSPPQL